MLINPRLLQVQGGERASGGGGHGVPQWSVQPGHQAAGDQDGRGGRRQGDRHRHQQAARPRAQVAGAVRVSQIHNQREGPASADIPLQHANISH